MGANYLRLDFPPVNALDAPTLRPVWIATANCGISRFELRADGFLRVLALNDTRHLAGL